jgi:Sulfotransferase domain
MQSKTVGHAGYWVARASGRLVAKLVRRPRLLPSFLVIGTKRGGSTSLYEYLIRHPGVVGCLLKKGSHYFDVNFSRGWSWYWSVFPLDLGRRTITGEASPYYMFHPLAPQRIVAALPHTRLIAVLRDPVDRAWSHYQYECRLGAEGLPFQQALEREPDRLAGEVERMLVDPGYSSFAHRHYSYLARGRYAEQLERFYTLVPPSRVLVLQSEALFADPGAQLARVWRFLDLEPHELGEASVFKAGHYLEAMPVTTRDWLQQYFAWHNQRLYGLPGIDFRWPAPAGPSA